MNVDVIIPVYNQFERLKYVLEGFSRQLSNHSIRIIIIDDGSEELPSYDLHEACLFDVEYIKLKVNKGRSFARNEGVRRASGSVIIFNDSDRIPDAYFVENHIEALKRKDTINIGSPFEIYESNIEKNYSRIWATVEGINKRGRLYPYAKKTDPLYERSVINTHPLIWLTTYSGNIALYRDTCLEYLFDEKMHRWGMENLEWGFRMYKGGLNFHRSYNCINYHLAHNRTLGFYEDGIRENYKYLLKKYDNNILITPLADFIMGKITLQDYESIIGY